jgi:RES domain-containing protein
VITTWRIVDAVYADDIFSGEGSRRFGARWQKAGHRLVYTSSSISLATLELIVNTPRAQLLTEYVIASCTFPEVLVEDVAEKQLPANWRDYPPPAEIQQIGTAWILSRSSAVLSVPSAVTPEERNYLLNPEHEHFRSVDAGSTRPFKIDLRLLT